jgi:hypothetical protein
LRALRAPGTSPLHERPRPLRQTVALDSFLPEELLDELALRVDVARALAGDVANREVEPREREQAAMQSLEKLCDAFEILIARLGAK